MARSIRRAGQPGRPEVGGVPRFLLRTKFGLEEIATHLQLRLGLVTPGPKPDDDAARGALLRIV